MLNTPRKRVKRVVNELTRRPSCFVISFPNTLQRASPEMSSEAPAWLNEKFVEKVLKTSKNDDSIKVKSVATKIATAVGDNYLSDILRATVEYSYEKLGRNVTDYESLIIKIAPTEEGAAKQLVLELKAFDMEIKMMGRTLGKMHELLDENDYRLSPRVLYSEIGDPTIIVMEDLATLGYRMGDRQIGLDLDHSIIVMRRLAKFHASSVALYEKDPEALSEYTDVNLKKTLPEVMKKFHVQELKAFANSLPDWSELGSRARSYSEKFLKIADMFDEKGLRSEEPKEVGDFKVLNHGDCWVANMLFRYNDEGKVIDHIFLDFQMCWWTSPIMDIMEILNTSLSEDVDANHHELLIEEYTEALTTTMHRLGCTTKPPTATAFKEMIQKNQFLTILTSCVVLATILVDNSDVRSVNETLEDDSYVNPVFEMPEFRKRIVRRILAWDASGILDV